MAGDGNGVGDEIKGRWEESGGGSVVSERGKKKKTRCSFPQGDKSPHKNLANEISRLNVATKVAVWISRIS